MPSRGTQAYTVRIEPRLVDLVEEALLRRNRWSLEMPWTFSDFFRTALIEKLAKMERSRRPRRRSRSARRLPLAEADASENVELQ